MHSLALLVVVEMMVVRIESSAARKVSESLSTLLLLLLLALLLLLFLCQSACQPRSLLKLLLPLLLKPHTLLLCRFLFGCLLEGHSCMAAWQQQQRCESVLNVVAEASGRVLWELLLLSVPAAAR